MLTGKPQKPKYQNWN